MPRAYSGFSRYNDESMPHRPVETLRLPKWVQELVDDRCLYTTVVEALVARQYAIDWGAREYKTEAKIFRAADNTLQMIADGRVYGEMACRKAADALRKFNTAGERAYFKKHKYDSRAASRAGGARARRPAR